MDDGLKFANLSREEKARIANDMTIGIGGRTTADAHLDLPPGDQISIDDDISTACPDSIPRAQNFGHPSED